MWYSHIKSQKIRKKLKKYFRGILPLFYPQKGVKVWKTVQKWKIIKKGRYNVIFSHKITKNTKKIKEIFSGPKNIFWAKKRPKMAQNEPKNGKLSKRVEIYLEFGSSDFDETLRKCSWYKENEYWWVWSHVHPFLPGHVHHLGPN